MTSITATSHTKSLLIIFILIILIGCGIYFYFDNKKTLYPQSSDNITVVPTMNDAISNNSVWCGTLQLIWNDMKNEIIGQNIIFTPQFEEVVNLNKEDFNTNMLSENYYYKIYGRKSLALKAKIKQGILDKFNETSDILDDFDWSENSLDNTNNNQIRYFLYTMLKRKFEFLNEFNKLKVGKFGNKYQNVTYFGINENTYNSVGNQINVLYYKSKDDFALILNTKENDEVILYKTKNGNTFNEIYKSMTQKANNYKGKKDFTDIDEFKMPNLKFDEKREYEELSNRTFPISSKKCLAEIGVSECDGVIEKAIQTIKFELNEKGGEIKSEAAIENITIGSVDKPKKNEPRYFYLDDTFVIFLREKGKELPYFAGMINDISKFQTEVIKIKN